MEGIFKTAVNGFKKSDVLTYIDKKEAEFRKKEQELNENIKSISACLEQAKQENGLLSAQVADLKAEMEKLRGDYAQLERQRDELKLKLSQACEELELQKMQDARQSADINELRQRVESKKQYIAQLENKIAELTEELVRSNKTKESVGRVLVEAQKTADAIVEHAKAEAEKILDEAKGRLSLLLERSEEFKNRLSAFRSRLDEFAQSNGQCISDIEQAVAEAWEDYRSAFSPAKPETAAEKADESPSADDTAASPADEDDAGQTQGQPGQQSPSAFDFSRPLTLS